MRQRLVDSWNAFETRVRRVYLIDVAWRSVQGFGKQGGGSSAAAIAYYVLFSLIPLLTVVVAGIGLVARDPAVEEEMVRAIVALFPEELDLESYVQTAVNRVTQANYEVVGVVALLGVLWSASGMFGALRRALNQAFDVPEARSFVHSKAIDLLGILGVTALVLVTLVVTALLGVLRTRVGAQFDGVPASRGWEALSIAVSVGLSFVTFLLMYRVVPDISARIRDLWPGALLAAIGVQAVLIGFGTYASRIVNFSIVFGTLAGAAALLSFVFIVAAILIFSGEVSAVLLSDRKERVVESSPVESAAPEARHHGRARD